MNETHEITMKGIAGMLATATGITTSFLPQVETWLRLTSLVVGITVGLVSLVALLKHKK